MKKTKKYLIVVLFVASALLIIFGYLNKKKSNVISIEEIEIIFEKPEKGIIENLHENGWKLIKKKRQESISGLDGYYYDHFSYVDNNKNGILDRSEPILKNGYEFPKEKCIHTLEYNIVWNKRKDNVTLDFKINLLSKERLLLVKSKKNTYNLLKSQNLRQLKSSNCFYNKKFFIIYYGDSFTVESINSPNAIKYFKKENSYFF